MPIRSFLFRAILYLLLALYYIFKAQIRQNGLIKVRTTTLSI